MSLVYRFSLKINPVIDLFARNWWLVLLRIMSYIPAFVTSAHIKIKNDCTRSELYFASLFIDLPSIGCDFITIFRKICSKYFWCFQLDNCTVRLIFRDALFCPEKNWFLQKPEQIWIYFFKKSESAVRDQRLVYVWLEDRKGHFAVSWSRYLDK